MRSPTRATSEPYQQANTLDTEVYVAGCEIFWRRVGEIERATDLDLSAKIA